MASKPTPPGKRKSKEPRLGSLPEEDQQRIIARTALRPTVQAGIAIAEFNTGSDLELKALIGALTEQTSKVKEGDLRRSEAMLTAQAHTLDAIFNILASRAINSKYMDNLDRYLKLALRAQSQSRATWVALATINR